ncbi:MAG TPA: N-acetylmuramoyl-L-alanine amidase [Clostridia bacterium]|nr:N-acetylmuramoyl-L-alanine amidase [Clostridia bacterium]
MITKKPVFYITLTVTVIITVISVIFCVVLAKRKHAIGQINAGYNSSAVTKKAKTVIIDPGHGGPDPGATGVGGVLEKNLNLIIAEKLKADFETEGYTVIMTRNDDRSINDPGCISLYDKKNSDLNNRIKIGASHPQAIFISIHQNFNDNSNYTGTQVYYSVNKPGSKLLAQDIQSEIRTDLQPSNSREIQEQGKLRVLLKAEIPAVLIECGFISNANDTHNLENSSYQERLDAAIVRATDTYIYNAAN